MLQPGQTTQWQWYIRPAARSVGVVMAGGAAAPPPRPPLLQGFQRRLEDGELRRRHIDATLPVGELHPLLCNLDEVLALRDLLLEPLDAMPHPFRGRRQVNRFH